MTIRPYLQASRRPGGRTDRRESINIRIMWWGLLVFLGLCLLGGGSNLPVMPSLILLRPVAIMFIAAMLVLASGRDAAMRVPTVLLATFTACIALQLVPLPPGLWADLPGRADLRRMAALVDEGDVWRPLSLTPAITLSSLFATLTGWVVLLSFGRLPAARRANLVPVVIFMAAASCIVGLLQLIGGTGSPFYFYNTDGSISGLLANRNHQAAFLAMTLPLLRVWMLQSDKGSELQRGLLAGALGILMLGAILLTGSRSGLVLGLIGTVAAYVIAPERVKSGKSGKSGRMRTLLRWATYAAPVVLVLVVIAVGRDLSVRRLFSADYAAEVRLRAFPTVLKLVKLYYPLGSGFGSFDTVFRMYEPDALLKPTFFNRAHNDYLELAITGGFPSLLVLAGFLIWVGRMAFQAFYQSRCNEGVVEARAGAVGVLILALASISDYPIRTPLISAVAVIFICWIANQRSTATSRAGNIVA